MISFQQRAELVERAITLLRDRYGITVAPSSPLGRSFALIEHEYELFKDRKLIDLTEDFRPVFRETSGVVNLLQRMFRADEHGVLSAGYGPHLEILAESAASQASPYLEAGVLSDKDLKRNSDKVFELVVGLSAALVGLDVELEPPNKRKSSFNPDMLVTIGGTRWGFPCKVISGRSEASWFELLRKGVEQLDRSPAERGCVIVNLRNLFDHNMLLPEHETTEINGRAARQFRAFDSRTVDKMVEDWMQEFNRDFVARFATDDAGNQLRSLFSRGSDGKDPKTAFGFLAYLETATIERRGSTLVPTPLSTSWFLYPSKVACPVPFAVEEMQKALSGPGGKPSKRYTSGRLIYQC